MDPGTGKLYDIVDAIDPKEKFLRLEQAQARARQQVTVEEARERGLVPVVRDLTVKEQADMQIRLYSPCACGSGKKFKFCCKR